MEQYNQKDDYLEAIKVQIRCKKARSLVTEEIGQHIEDQKAAYIIDGDDEQTAMAKAIKQMGDATEIGKQLDRIHRPRMEWSILLFVFILCCLGVAAQLSLGNMLTVHKLPNSVNVERHILFLIIGSLLMTALYFFDYSFIGRYPKILCILFFAVFFLYAPHGRVVNGSIQYLHSYALLLIPIYGGILYAYRRKGYRGLILCLIISIISSIIEMKFVAQSAIYLGVLLSSLIMLSFAVMKNWFGISKKIGIAVVWGWIPLAFGILSLSDISILTQYQMMRLEHFMNSILNANIYGEYQADWAREIISRAQLFGGSSDIMKNYMSGYNSEYILTYVIRSWGIVAGLLIIGLFITIAGRMIHLSCHQENSLGMFVSLGCSLVFTVQGIIYILSNFGIQLIAQVNLPFISYGGSSLLVNFIVLGLMLSVFRNTNIMKEVPYTGKPAFKIKIERVK